ncbi:serine hydrolase, partial [Staphylococcus aureus]
LPLDEKLTVTADDIDTEKNTGSRLAVGTTLTRGDMLHLALMASENRAAHALGRNYPGGLSAFVAAMNAKAESLGMADTHY